MEISNIGSLDNYKLNLVDKTDNKSIVNDNASIFETFLDASTKLYSETNALQNDVTNKQIAFATGESDNILEVMLAQEKANTSLTFTTQVTNKLIEAYREIMQVQL